MSGIRVTYSGLISLLGGLITIVTGLIFTIVITRTLTTSEYGTWGLINGLIFYVAAIGPVISYWVTREIARGIESGKTAVMSSGLFSVGGMFVYIIIAYFVGLQTNADQNSLFFAAILIPFMFLNGILTAINLGWKPHVASYAALSIGVAQIPMTLIFTRFFDMGIEGLILAVVIAYVISDIILIIYGREKIKHRFKKEFLQKWLRLSWIPLYPGLALIVAGLDVVIFSIITGSVLGLAFWSAAMAMPSIISHSGLISKAVYPKLLGTSNREYVQENLTYLFYFMILFTSIVITFARPGLFALNPLFEIAVPITILLAIYMFFNVQSNVFLSFLTGIERVDASEKSTFKDYVKSKLFFLPTLRLIQYSTYVILLTVGLLLLHAKSTQLQLLIYWSITILITEIPVTIYLYILVRKNFTLKIELSSVVKYLLVSIGVFGITYFLTEQYLSYKEGIFEFLPNLLLSIGLGIGGYLIITYSVDNRTRRLFSAILKEIKGNIH
ncbi:MAG: hypothetical protein ACREAE_05080 [Nitrosopumilaceae archaeon]